ncbi:YgzB family protein [Belliella kenyensis]|uniref:YgzB family protein n=1 Tax=Belliella kenyensis TaxID=1472724 RepID=A0ABV8ENP9_9BACT|nr:YgzB family protein [Belliella kenyensis]MCH7401468.1 YgzB family protein [Belliella kenyensis]MDN3603251.1 YgzB family protein [Belliella kenyensis]
MGEKKCPHCGEWSKWTTDINDKCEHCGQPLGGRDLEYKEIRDRDTKANEEQWIFYIKESDSELVKSMKKVGNFFYTVYMAIITFLAWVIAALPG